MEKNNYSLKGLLEHRIREMDYIIVGEWRDSLKNGWRIEVKTRMPGSEENYRYSTVYAEDLLCDMLNEELRATRGNRDKMLAE